MGIHYPPINRETLTHMAPFMAESHIASLDKLLGGDVLEIGSGGSTLRWAPQCDSWTTVEHDSHWAEKLRILLEKQGKDAHLIEIPVPGYFKEGDPVVFADYLNAVRAQERKFDFILIDGRCRVDCARICLTKLKPDGMVLLHDFERPRYHQVMEHYKVVELVRATTSVSELALLKPLP